MNTILITYHGKQVLVNVLEDYKVVVLGIEDEEQIDLILDQCKKCGVWKSEDEELYGGGYCENCAVMCIECEEYVNPDRTIKAGDEYLCDKCLIKRLDK